MDSISEVMHYIFEMINKPQIQGVVTDDMETLNYCCKLNHMVSAMTDSDIEADKPISHKETVLFICNHCAIFYLNIVLISTDQHLWHMCELFKEL